MSLPSRSRPLLAALALLATACTSDDVTAPPPPPEGSFTLDATQRWTYVSLGDSAIVSPTPSANQSPAWDIAFFASNATLNGGQAGPGGVTGFCICQNVTATDQQVLAMTADSEQADFDAVTSVPAGATFVEDVLTPAIAGWFTGTGASATADPARVFLVRLADSLAYAKVHVTSITGATATSAGQVTLEYAVQASPTAELGTSRTLTVDLSTGAKSIDLDAGAITTSATDWDLRLDGFTIRVNGGISGPGKGGAAASTGSYESITTAKTQDQAYQIDRYAGVFGTHRYYRYNIAGDNRISPTFDVYLIKRGSAVYKLQIIDYYNATGQPRHVAFRYKQIAG